MYEFLKIWTLFFFNVNISASGPDPHSYGQRSLRSSPGVSDKVLYSERFERFEALVSLPLFGDQKPSHLMNRMLALLPDDYKPEFIRCALTSSPLESLGPSSFGSESRWIPLISSSSVNLLSEVLDESLQVNTVLYRTRPPKAPSSRRSSTPAPSSRSPTPPGAYWFHKKHGDKAVNFRKPCSILEN